MKKLLIGIFLFPWKFAFRSESACISMFCFALIISFTILVYPVYLLFGSIFEGEFLIVITMMASFYGSAFLTWLYPQIANPLI